MPPHVMRHDELYEYLLPLEAIAKVKSEKLIIESRLFMNTAHLLAHLPDAQGGGNVNDKVKFWLSAYAEGFFA